MEMPHYPTVDREEEKTVDEIQKELQSAYSKLIFKTSAQTVGETAHTATNDSKFGHSSRFSKPLGQSGMFRNSGLNTCVEKDKVFDGAKDWMDKIS
mmetsp:Transcript_9071/g.10264  ORF Transcript_9071/g.10264 Transcript_9071/m.10264 type:complete len:96 (+) Transcript_9071:19-306(+)